MGPTKYAEVGDEIWYAYFDENMTVIVTKHKVTKVRISRGATYYIDPAVRRVERLREDVYNEVMCTWVGCHRVSLTREGALAVLRRRVLAKLGAAETMRIGCEAKLAVLNNMD
jgi:hypothetical protein